MDQKNVSKMKRKVNKMMESEVVFGFETARRGQDADVERKRLKMFSLGVTRTNRIRRKEMNGELAGNVKELNPGKEVRRNTRDDISGGDESVCCKRRR